MDLPDHVWVPIDQNTTLQGAVTAGISALGSSIIPPNVGDAIVLSLHGFVTDRENIRDGETIILAEVKSVHKVKVLKTIQID